MRDPPRVPRPLRVLILTASIGEGHDLPAFALAEGISAEDPTAQVDVVDALAAVGGMTERLATKGSRFHSEWGKRLYDLEYRLITTFAPTRWLAGLFFVDPASRRILPVIAATRPDVVVSTYPGATEGLARRRARGRLDPPVVSAITDLAALHYWAHPGVDLHLITHPESAHEIREIAPGAALTCVRGLTSRAFYEPADPLGWRRARGVPDGVRVVAVSGGGWAVGDLAGATRVALYAGAEAVVVLGGRNETVRSALAADFSTDWRVTVLGFEERMSDLLAATDVVVHSTAGLTVLEAIMRGARVVSYGWGRGHIRANNEAYERFGMAAVARSPAELDRAIREALAHPASPDESFLGLPSAASEVLSLAREARREDHPRSPGPVAGAPDPRGR